jgi:cell division protein FtsW (lipid II flippase)
MKLNPLKISFFYIAIHILVSIILMSTVFSRGGESFEFVVESMRLFFIGLMSVIIFSSLYYWAWSKKNWVVILIAILTCAAALLSGFGLSK